PDPDAYDVIIPRNVTIPVVKEKMYRTAADNQTRVEVDVYQGEFKKASHNNFLGRFLLSGVPPAPAHTEKISISFAYDVNGILQAEAKILSTGGKANITIETTVAAMVVEVDTEGWDKATNARKYTAIIKKALRLVGAGEALYYANDIESLVSKIKIGLVKGESVAVLDRYKDELQEMIFELTEDSNV
ncbi:MAG: Hsp70 family protein, partial [Bacillota bacterium]|nr:Hsp70 family protein [Bacillota bacterium]